MSPVANSVGGRNAVRVQRHAGNANSASKTAAMLHVFLHTRAVVEPFSAHARLPRVAAARHAMSAMPMPQRRCLRDDMYFLSAGSLPSLILQESSLQTFQLFSGYFQLSSLFFILSHASLRLFHCR
jgi:hypothetical protein